MQLQRRNAGLVGRVALGEESTNFAKKVITYSRAHASTCDAQIGCRLASLFIDQDLGFLFKNDAIAIDRDTRPLVRKDASVFAPRSDPNVFLTVTGQRSAGICQHQLCAAFVELAISGAEHNFIALSRPIEFPGSLEQLEELGDDGAFRRVCNDGNHELLEVVRVRGVGESCDDANWVSCPDTC